MNLFSSMVAETESQAPEIIDGDSPDEVTEEEVMKTISDEYQGKSFWARHRCAFITLGSTLLGVGLVLTLALLGATQGWWLHHNPLAGPLAQAKGTAPRAAHWPWNFGYSSDVLPAEENLCEVVFVIDFPESAPQHPAFEDLLQEEELVEYISDKCPQEFGLFKIPDNELEYYCQICGVQPLRANSVAYGCHREYTFDHSPEWDNVGCCLECYRTLGERGAREVLQDRDNASYEFEGLEKEYTYMGVRDSEGFGVFMVPHHWMYCPLCPAEKRQNTGKKALAYGCHTNADSAESRGWNGKGCCMQCVNRYGSLKQAKSAIKQHFSESPRWWSWSQLAHKQ